MVNIRSRKWKISRKRNVKRKAKVNPGYAISRDNMVYMKQLHRGKDYMKYNYGNPTSSNTGFLRGRQIDNKKHILKYKKSKKRTFLRNSFRSEL